MKPTLTHADRRIVHGLRSVAAAAATYDVPKKKKTLSILEGTKFLIIKPTRCTISQIYFGKKFYMFRTVPLSNIRSFFTVHTAVLYVIEVCWQLASRIRMERSSILILLARCQQTSMTYTIAVCTVKKTSDDGQRNCPKHVEFLSKINLRN